MKQSRVTERPLKDLNISVIDNYFQLLPLFMLRLIALVVD